jgi:tetratricopeptide (TPR) repeat protein
MLHLKRSAVLLFFVLINASVIADENVNNAKLFLDEGITLFKEEKYFEAIDSLRNALEINPFYGDAYKYLASVYFSLGEYRVSLANALPALKYANNDPDALLIVANSYRELGNYQQSEEYYKNIVEKFPSYVEVYRNLGELYLKMNRLSPALEMLGKADRINKNYWRNYISFGNYYLKVGSLSKAEEYFKKAFNLNPTERQVYVALSDFYRSTDNYDRAIELLENGEKIFDNFYSGILILADSYLATAPNKNENYQKAINKYMWINQAGVKKDNDFKGWLFYKIGLAYEKMDKEKAVKSYFEALSFQPKNELILYSLENFALLNFKIDSSIRKQLSLIHLNNANSAYSEGESKAYLLQLKRAVTLYPFLLEARKKITAYFEMQGDYFHAYEELKSASKLNPDFRMKDKLENYEWKIKNKKIPLDKTQFYYYKGVFLADANFYNFSKIYPGLFLYDSQYYDKFKFSVMDYRKKQGINYILQYLRENDIDFFVVSSLDQNQKTLKFFLFDKTGKVMDELAINFSVEVINKSAVTFLDWMDKAFPSIWAIGEEISPQKYALFAGEKEGLKAKDEITAIDLFNREIRTISLLKLEKLNTFSSIVFVVSNYRKGEQESLKDKFAVKKDVLTQNSLTKLKRILGY